MTSTVWSRITLSSASCTTASLSASRAEVACSADGSELLPDTSQHTGMYAAGLPRWSPKTPGAVSQQLGSRAVGLPSGKQHDQCSHITDQAAGAWTCLIEQQQCWSANQRSCNCDALFLTA